VILVIENLKGKTLCHHLRLVSLIFIALTAAHLRSSAISAFACATISFNSSSGIPTTGSCYSPHGRPCLIDHLRFSLAAMREFRVDLPDELIDRMFAIP
jgi:hypothetical protein